MKIHFCLVSNQTLPNFLPVLDPKSKPDRVLLLVTPEMKAVADHLMDVFRENGCAAKNIFVSDAYNMLEIEKAVLDALAEAGQQGDVILNATGGTKIMMAAAYAVFRELGLPVFYIDTMNKQRIEMLPKYRLEALPDLMTVKRYLKVYGYRLSDSAAVQIRPEVITLAETLIAKSKKYNQVIGTLNWLAKDAEERKGNKAELSPGAAAKKDLSALIQLFEEAGLLSRSGSRCVFADEKARQITKGGWLELYLAHIAKRLKKEGKITDFYCNACIQSSGGSRNELDLVFSAHNRLHIVECKAKNMTAETGKADDATYKLETLRDLVGGTFGRAMLVSYGSLRDVDRKRCKEYGIRVVEGEELVRLREKLLAWINS